VPSFVTLSSSSSVAATEATVGAQMVDDHVALHRLRRTVYYVVDINGMDEVAGR